MSDRASILLAMVCVIFLAACTFLIGNATVTLLDRDEPRYAECSREMLQGSPEHPGPDWVVPRQMGRLRPQKPVFIYWCQASVMSVLGDNSFSVRLPSAVAMLLTTILLGVAVARGIGLRRGMWTILVFASSLIVIVAAKMCITDAMLLLWIVIGQICLYTLYRGTGGWKAVLIFWIVAGLAVLTKGPVALGAHLALLIVLALLKWRVNRKFTVRWWIRIHPEIGIPIVLVICGPWLYQLYHREPEMFWMMLGQLKKHVGNAAEGHWGPPGYYLLTVWGTFLPWSLILPTVITLAWKHRANPIIQFAMAAAIGPWIMMECVPSKLPHYLLPSIPALAFLTGDTIVRSLRRQHDDMYRPIFAKAAWVWAGIIAVMGLLPWAALIWFKDAPIPAMVAVSGVNVIYGIIVARWLARKEISRGLFVMGVGWFVVMGVGYSVFLPRAEFLRVSQNVADILKQHGGGAPETSVVMLHDDKLGGYWEPSLAFYQGGTIRESIDMDFEKWPRFVTMSPEMYAALTDPQRARLTILGKVHGWAYADKLQIMDVWVAEKK